MPTSSWARNLILNSADQTRNGVRGVNTCLLRHFHLTDLRFPQGYEEYRNAHVGRPAQYRDVLDLLRERSVSIHKLSTVNCRVAFKTSRNAAEHGSSARQTPHTAGPRGRSRDGETAGVNPRGRSCSRGYRYVVELSGGEPVAPLASPDDSDSDESSSRPMGLECLGLHGYSTGGRASSREHVDELGNVVSRPSDHVSVHSGNIKISEAHIETDSETNRTLDNRKPDQIKSKVSNTINKNVPGAWLGDFGEAQAGRHGVIRDSSNSNATFQISGEDRQNTPTSRNDSPIANMKPPCPQIAVTVMCGNEIVTRKSYGHGGGSDKFNYGNHDDTADSCSRNVSITHHHAANSRSQQQMVKTFHDVTIRQKDKHKRRESDDQGARFDHGDQDKRHDRTVNINCQLGDNVMSRSANRSSPSCRTTTPVTHSGKGSRRHSSSGSSKRWHRPSSTSTRLYVTSPAMTSSPRPCSFYIEDEGVRLTHKNVKSLVEDSLAAYGHTNTHVAEVMWQARGYPIGRFKTKNRWVVTLSDRLACVNVTKKGIMIGHEKLPCKLYDDVGTTSLNVMTL